ncbi:hypothetical protein NGM10_09980 [Halorussus salilacus]|uniref:hypothetical protein n=1 Tax=Halorussus salilacus TaxID=2953750 RepID=UPI00209EE53F|nr:hypothetical protein [Halorussus salilacus]USZ67058.1 hypothetical protein NGM10_09980 [Halorussus salilacus]
MKFSRRSLLGLSATTLVPITAGCSGLRAGSNDDAESNAAGGRGAADVNVHNLHDETIGVSIRAERTESDSDSDETVPIDQTVELDPAETHTIHNKVLYGSEYDISVGLEEGYDEEATWTPESGGGLHLLYDGSDNVVFADEFA